MMGLMAYNVQSCKKKTEGCTDPSADNYNPDANEDNCTCEWKGCTDPRAYNFNNSATHNDGSCLYYECTDPNSDNYLVSSTTPDGTCTYDNLYAANWTIDDGGCGLSLDGSCMMFFPADSLGYSDSVIFMDDIFLNDTDDKLALIFEDSIWIPEQDYQTQTFLTSQFKGRGVRNATRDTLFFEIEWRDLSPIGGGWKTCSDVKFILQ